MGTLSFTATVSLDGYASGPGNDFQFGSPDEEVFRFHVERMGSVSTEILGRRTYELMRYWESEPAGEDWSDDEREFARRWRELDIVVASSTLAPGELTHPRGRLIDDLDLEQMQRIAEDAAGEVEIFGPTTAAPAMRAGLVRDIRFFIVPKVLGGGLRALPDDVSLGFELVENRTFANGFVFLHYRSR